MLSLERAIDRALVKNFDYLNLIDRSTLASLRYEDARSFYKTQLGSNASSDARVGSSIGSNYSLFLTKNNESGSSYSAGYYNSSFNDRTLSELRFSYTLPFFNPNQRNHQLNVDQAEISRSRSARMVEIGKQELINEVKTTYYRLAMSMDYEHWAEDQVDLAARLYMAEQILNENGEISDLDLAQANLKLAEAQNYQRQKHLERMRLENRFKLLVGSSMDESLTINPNTLIDTEETLQSLELVDLEKQALSARTELLALNEELNLAARRIQFKTTDNLPPIEVSLQFSLIGNGDSISDSFNVDDQRFGIGVRMNTDLNKASQGYENEQLHTRYNGLRREYEHLRNSIIAEIRYSYQSALQAQQLMAHSEQVLQLEKTRHLQDEIKFGQGELSEIDYLQSQLRLRNAQISQRSYRLEYILAEQQLILASGYQ